MGRPSLKAKRRQDLIGACIETLHQDGFEAASLARIARRAGLTAGIVSHYFADKSDLMEATMRYLGQQHGRRQAERLRAARTPNDRLTAILSANLGPEQFRPDITAAWLSFWARVNHVPSLARLQRVNSTRLTSNLRHALRPLIPDDLPSREREIRRIAIGVSTLIDGLWLHAALAHGGVDPTETLALAQDYVDAELQSLLRRRP